MLSVVKMIPVLNTEASFEAVTETRRASFMHCARISIMKTESNRPTLSRRRSATFRDYKKLGERAFAQLSDEDFFRTIDDESNSIAVIIKHIAGNMLSRWTDFLTTDGEKPERNRDMEFVMLPERRRTRCSRFWEKGWKCTFEALEPLTPDDLMRTVKIRGEDHTVVQAINRQIAHYANHIGQIVYLAKHFKSSEWQSLSVPKNKSAEFNAQCQKPVPVES